MNKKTKYIVMVGILTAMATVLYYLLEVPVGAIFGMPHLKFDFSDIPAMIGAVTLGPAAGVLIEFLKALLHLPKTTTFGIGDAINFFIGAAMILSFCGVSKLCLKRGMKRVASYTVGLCVAGVATVIAGAASNYFLFPVYFALMGQESNMAVVMTAVTSSILLNVLKSALTILPVAPLIERLEKLYERQSAVKTPAGSKVQTPA